MNENINLCEILRGLEGIELYSSVNGEVKLYYIKSFSNYPIKCIDKYNNEVSFTIKGKYIENNIGECILFPSKDQRDWSKFERPIAKDAPIICFDANSYWIIKRYYGIVDGKHKVYIDQGGSKSDIIHYCDYTSYKYMIPYDKFDINNIEKSLKYNINK